MLIKDPWHEISYMDFQHSIEPDCDVHLIASAFPRIKELVLSNILKYDGQYFWLLFKSLSRWISYFIFILFYLYLFFSYSDVNTDEDGNNRAKKRLEKRLRRENDSPEVEDQTDDKSSFELLIENTQNVKDLTIYSRYDLLGYK